MTRLKVLLACVSVSALAACASGPAQVSMRGPVGQNYSLFDTRTSYGQFLAGQAALRDGNSKEAATYFGTAAVLGEDPGVIAERSFTALLLSGEISRAAAAAPTEAGGTEAIRRLGVLTRVVEALALGKGKEAQALLKSDPPGFPHQQAVALLGPWAAAAAGDKEGAIVQPVLRNDKLVQYFGQQGQARLFERAKRYDEAETDYKALTSNAATASIFTLDYGAFLERRKRYDDALALYDAALRAAPNDTGLLRARARAAARSAPPSAPTLRQGAAEGLIACAATFAGERQNQFALAYLRLALRLDPGRDEAWILVGDLLNQGDDHQAAIEAYGRVPAGAPLYASAQSKIAWAWSALGDKTKALDVARAALTAAPNDRDAAVALADLLRASSRWDESVAVLDLLLAREAEAPDWRLLYMRAIALEQGGRWPEAEKDLQTALKVNPDEPDLLNFLGYSWIDRNERLPEALAMVEKAVAARPQSGAMMDSLGWAYFRLGDYKTAIEKLEAAVELEPGDPDINGHLGDAYWKAGRTIEARFQWQRVLSLEPTDKQKADSEDKLKNGLGLSTPATKSTIAHN
ncbi:tetratricopeptide repeat protein [Caulobacter vibrioides]|uniref:TPR domain protein n=2 Tax=Caulobacter vibrioides TaxID=155892 RepID=Q9A8L8_CAUVC|nr:tetratricopeptide repeat protein [Caulobacter vibrioides]YP_002516769.1 tetratricopeptide repeat family protein TtpA [Caulobacter vibrioides NA1000]AAK23316.1 TPR domain protein [Caulobacter vibrioides CB15]ACL94861.1 tetratricopeptide repeat family protein TtpA [Caulobacter vibrioides NA1000]ATC28149.1 tetratricopeptide repeat protein [Caulobacter vibrioides]QXZ53413.1 tetratricopeptide repeat protein [Caulobacter vibrioides]